MYPADKDTSIGKLGAGGAQARNINIGKRATNRPPADGPSARERSKEGDQYS